MSIQVCDLFKKHVEQTKTKFNKEDIDSKAVLDIPKTTTLPSIEKEKKETIFLDGKETDKESIKKGTNSFLIALVLVLIWMCFYYGRAGLFADAALVLNIII